MSKHKNPITGEIESQITYLKRIGRYGSVGDPQWNRETKRHDCCGATRAYYHKKDCPLVKDLG